MINITFIILGIRVVATIRVHQTTISRTLWDYTHYVQACVGFSAWWGGGGGGGGVRTAIW